MARNLHVVARLVQVFGLRLRFLWLLGFRLSLTFFSWMTLGLDRLLFPGHARQALERPLFLVGHLRSGTTFLHRYLAGLLPEHRSMVLWEMVFPALSARALLRPFLPLMKKVSFGKVWDPAIHETGFFEPETDDIALSMRYFDGLLSWIYFHSWQEYPSDEAFAAALVRTVEQDHFVDYLHGVYRRNVHGTKQTMFSKSFCLLFNLETVRRRFPGARFLLMVRDPVEAVVSMLSLERSVQRRMNDIDHQPAALRARYYRNLYRTSLAYYRRFCEEAARQSEDALVVEYPDLFRDFEGTLVRAAKLAGVEPTPQLLEGIRAQAARQGGFASAHKYTPEEFGLTAEQIRSDFAFVYLQFPRLAGGGA
ncbi:MAG TPA: sulfotransferase [Myxococcales bacterium]|jgi:hypothetical protein